jgi:DNA-binding NarL/FixJ family response regulator
MGPWYHFSAQRSSARRVFGGCGRGQNGGARRLTDKRIRVALAEDQRLVRRMLCLYVGSREDMEVVGEAADGAGAVRLCLRERPDVILMDLDMPGTDGIAATREISTLLADTTSVLVLSAHTDDEHVFAAVKAGAKGYLNKDCSPEELASAVREVRSGEVTLRPEMARRTLRSLSPARTPADRKVGSVSALTRREVEIVRAVVEGKSRKQIATSLYISESTVRNHITNVYKKLKIHDRTQAVLYAVRHGLVDPHRLPD